MVRADAYPLLDLFYKNQIVEIRIIKNCSSADI